MVVNPCHISPTKYDLHNCCRESFLTNYLWSLKILSRRALFWRLAQNLTFVASAYTIVGSFQQQLGFRDKKCLNDQHYKRVFLKTVNTIFHMLQLTKTC